MAVSLCTNIDDYRSGIYHVTCIHLTVLLMYINIPFYCYYLRF